MTKPISDPVDLKVCGYYAVQAPLESAADIFAYYDRLREYVQHEDELINSRLTWSLTIHGFLFAIYGVLLVKGADLFVELAKQTDPRSRLLLEHVISGLLGFQIPVAAFGFIVGHRSKGAIIAAHNAIQHLLAIANGSAALNAGKMAWTLEIVVTPGKHSIAPNPMWPACVKGAFVVDEGVAGKEEIVQLAASAGGKFEFEFTRPHDKGASIRALDTALLPGLLGGGDKGGLTGGARSYYLALPHWAMVIWIVLLVSSLVFCSTSLFARCWFFSWIAG